MTEQRNALVVDDHPTNRLLACALLKKFGWTVFEAECGTMALTMAAEHQFRLVLLDISMPGLSGEETCAALRAAETAQRLHIVAYTAHAFPEDEQRLLACGFDEVLVKPISRQRIEDLVAKL
ncbi:response regulator [Dechloromonas sp. HYN0024]|uniref:response regulator n=1 Tax=Dechloromonas sp. HYN0024 TaxID=2231055 RepID=UPI000E4470E3|nr:response regulator [Dechloromonas sp. HYN0024]AXS80672.1 response regulator [Dechloromonas sp. HYN0024]